MHAANHELKVAEDHIPTLNKRLEEAKENIKGEAISMKM